ncbi:MAG TPA: thiamine-phosphate kinase [Pseudacidobacterium sp.]|jgi:thiamine-monophosphate kinase|nr:thiamine-phosphate kinase [Pseudacidobacterium sp.]
MLIFVSGKIKPGLAPGERTLIAGIRKRVSARGIVRTSIGDDCAVLRPSAKDEILITTDFSLEQVHFRRDWHPPESAGHRCLARGLSDLAAMGAKPAAVFLSLAVPAELTVGERGVSWVERFLNGLLALADKHRVPLAGGDTAQSPVFDEAGRKQSGMVSADIILVGTAPRGRALLRSGAKPGDIIYVTGSLGGAEAELLALGRNPQAFRKLTKAAQQHPHLYPEPRLAVGARLLSSRIANSAIDISDGLSTDLTHLCEESGVAAEIDVSAIPVHPLAQKAESDGWIPSALHLALHGGEDYELLFTTSPNKKIPSRIAGVPIHAIGRMKQRRPRKSLIEAIEKNGKRVPLDAGGWEHFS